MGGHPSRLGLPSSTRRLSSSLGQITLLGETGDTPRDHPEITLLGETGGALPRDGRRLPCPSGAAT